MRQLILFSLITLLTIFNSPVFADNSNNDTHAGRAITYSGQASVAASGSAAHSIAASGQVTSAASAMPLAIGGAVLGSGGAVSAGAARDSMKAATAPIGTPLPITNENITIMPPNEMLKAKETDKKSDKSL
jgi:hypothetical protein